MVDPHGCPSGIYLPERGHLFEYRGSCHGNPDVNFHDGQWYHGMNRGKLELHARPCGMYHGHGSRELRASHFHGRIHE